MKTIKLDSEYQIELSEIQYILQRKRLATNKETGEKYEVIDNIGYYGRLSHLLQSVIERKLLDGSCEDVLELHNSVLNLYKYIDECVNKLIKEEYYENS